MGETRHAIIKQVADCVSEQAPGRPTRIGVDGRTAAGKTTFANELADALTVAGRQVVTASIDAFHRPRSERYAQGRRSATGCYNDARDYEAVARLLLAPLGPGGDYRYRTESFDLASDRPIFQMPFQGGPDMILEGDGRFLARPELAPYWDGFVLLDIAEETSLKCGPIRDADRLGGLGEAAQIYRGRYLPSWKIYENECHPELAADFVLSNEIPDAPTLNWRVEPYVAR